MRLHHTFRKIRIHAPHGGFAVDKKIICAAVGRFVAYQEHIGKAACGIDGKRHGGIVKPVNGKVFDVRFYQIFGIYYLNACEKVGDGLRKQRHALRAFHCHFAVRGTDEFIFTRRVFYCHGRYLTRVYGVNLIKFTRIGGRHVAVLRYVRIALFRKKLHKQNRHDKNDNADTARAYADKSFFCVHHRYFLLRQVTTHTTAQQAGTSAMQIIATI